MEEKKARKKMILLILALAILTITISLILVFYLNTSINTTIASTGKIDDWEYDPDKYNYSNNFSGSAGSTSWTPQANSSAASLDGTFSSLSPNTATSSSSNIGFSTGGAKDINNFRENIKEGYFPISTDITYNGLFYDYTFDTGNTNTNQDDLFYPSYSTAISKDPISEKNEYYMTVGLNSNIKEEDFKRKKLNLVVVLDISGSMSSPFNSYYYDNNTEKENEDTDSNKSKMEIANESVNILIDQLNEDDRYGMVLFESSAYKAKPLNLVKDVDMEAIKDHVLDIEAIGGTNFEAGYSEATDLFDEYKDANSDEYENRIIVLTDAMPNTGSTSKNSLLSMVEQNSNDGIYTTFIGIGVDFNTELIETISDVKGANYYSVHNSKEFKDRMGEQFEYMVTPLVFDLKLDMKSDSYKISGIYGSDTVNKETGNIMNVNTLFPSKTTSDGEVKGGVILLKLSKINTDKNSSSDITLNVSYKDRNGKEHQNSQTINFSDSNPYYDNTGIRKAIVLTRYANLIKDWILYERSDNNQEFLITANTGITDCIYTEDEIYRILGEHERTSVKLTVSEDYKKLFTTLKSYLETEKDEIQDDTLEQEIEILNTLIK